ncbi:hypothetical protein BDQ17DRAFT_1301569 [Cyathus striatus]|nr:hypothetical protein BDQ17DRAFT_1301569 [Cyathus striatus]
MVDHSQELKYTVIDRSTFRASTHNIPVTNEQTQLFYRTKNGISCVDLLNRSESDVESLAAACEPATYGVNSELDLTQCKALKMDKKHFATNFELIQADIGLDVLSFMETNIMHGKNDVSAYYRAEIDQLNVYGKDSFVKKHKCSRGDDLVAGYLVIAFPTATPCEGGELNFFHKDESWIWDSAEVLRNAEPRSIAYVAFIGDTEVSLSPVTKGYKVMLSYKLYFLNRDPNNISVISPSGITNETMFKTALYNALKDPKFLPDGGYLGFGLCCVYDIDMEKSKLKTFKDILKAGDDMTRKVCEQLGLEVDVKALYPKIDYRDENLQGDFVLDEIVNPYLVGNADEETFVHEHKGWRAFPVDDTGELDEDVCEGMREHAIPPVEPVLWVTDPQHYSEFCSQYAHDELGPHELYKISGYICLLAKVTCSDSTQRTTLHLN